MHATLIVSCHQIVLIFIHPRSDVTNVASAAFCQHHHISTSAHCHQHWQWQHWDNCQSRNLLPSPCCYSAVVVLLLPAPWLMLLRWPVLGPQQLGSLVSGPDKWPVDRLQTVQTVLIRFQLQRQDLKILSKIFLRIYIYARILFIYSGPTCIIQCCWYPFAMFSTVTSTKSY